MEPESSVRATVYFRSYGWEPESMLPESESMLPESESMLLEPESMLSFENRVSPSPWTLDYGLGLDKKRNGTGNGQGRPW